jgi:ribose transport system ATP-binding protein
MRQQPALHQRRTGVSGAETAPGSHEPGAPPSLVIRALSKTFGTKTVLDSFDLALQPGEIHVLLGQNGSGKSTLIKILSGYHVPDPGGEVLVGGQRLRFGVPGSSHALGCRFVHQDLGLIDTSSILDNLLYTTGFPTKGGTIRRCAARRQAQAALASVGLEHDPNEMVSSLGAAERTGIAVARAMTSENDAPARVLVLDEPTATLPAAEVGRLLGTLRTAAARGVSILYVTHHLGEVGNFADRVTVLRDGVQVVTSPVASMDHAELVHQLIGSELESMHRPPSPPAEMFDRAPVLTVRGLTAGPLEDLELMVWTGEVVGICGLTGSGRELLLGSIFGARERETGQVSVAGRVLPPGRTDLSIKAGVGYLPPDRRTSGGLMELTARENLTLVNLRQFWRGMRLRSRHEAAEVARWFEQLDIRPSDGIDWPLGTFSGGNQQKVLFGKWLRESPKLLLLDDPTQGVDVGAKAALHRQILAAAASGAAVLVSSTDIDELVSLCTRVLVIGNGHVAEEITGDDVTTTAVTAASVMTPSTQRMQV